MCGSDELTKDERKTRHSQAKTAGSTTGEDEHKIAVQVTTT